MKNCIQNMIKNIPFNHPIKRIYKNEKKTIIINICFNGTKAYLI